MHLLEATEEAWPCRQVRSRAIIQIPRRFLTCPPGVLRRFTKTKAVCRTRKAWNNILRWRQPRQQSQLEQPAVIRLRPHLCQYPDPAGRLENLMAVLPRQITNRSRCLTLGALALQMTCQYPMQATSASSAMVKIQSTGHQIERRLRYHRLAFHGEAHSLTLQHSHR